MKNEYFMTVRMFHHCTLYITKKFLLWLETTCSKVLMALILDNIERTYVYTYVVLIKNWHGLSHRLLIKYHFSFTSPFSFLFMFASIVISLTSLVDVSKNHNSYELWYWLVTVFSIFITFNIQLQSLMLNINDTSIS